ncbi:MAG: cob(I)yrinic acid a,c-diamide adenosyltransferase [Microgenomates group bacterium]
MKKDVKSAIAADLARADMSIYTKTGDKGETSLFGKTRVSKSDPTINACGTIDELESFIGLVISKLSSTEDKELLTEIQTNLYKIMGYLVGARKGEMVTLSDVKALEKRIDTIQDRVPKLTRFILPQGTEVSSWFHVLRAISRRAERSIVALEIDNEIILQYINRLSDLFFMLARQYNESVTTKVVGIR